MNIIPGSLPILSPFSPGLTEVTYHLALTTQRIEPQGEFVLLDVGHFDHWETPLVGYSLSVEPVSRLFGADDNPLLDNLHFTYQGATPLIGPQILGPFTGLILQDTAELVTRSQNFATFGYQVIPDVHMLRAQVIPEPGVVALAVLGLIALRATHSYRTLWRRPSRQR